MFIKIIIFVLCAVLSRGALFFTFDSSFLFSSGEQNGFIFTAPKVLWSGRKETACISFHGENAGRANVTVKIETTLNRDLAITKRGLETENGGCFEIKVPNTTDQHAKIHLRVNFSDQNNYSINSVDNVKIYPSNGVTFIQTDKEVYAPGQRVKIRILKLNQELGVPNDLIIPFVKIRNPVGIAIGLWENVTTELGLVQLEHQLSQETILGNWYIESTDDTKAFEVKEYVLPRFEVLFESLQPVFIKEASFNFTVCARYSYGRSVKGTAHLKIKLVSNEHSVNLIKELQNGCTTITVKNEEILPKSIYNPYVTESLSLQATVTEHGTDLTEVKSESVEIVLDKYTLTFTDMLPYFQIGLPYYGHIKVDSNYENVLNKSINICYNLAINYSWNLTDLTCRDFSLNDNVVDFVILPEKNDTYSIKITATIKDNEDRVQIAQYNLERWNSPSNSYLQIVLNDTNPIKCKTAKPINVLYTFNDTLTNDTLIFHYMVMTKGHLIKYGKVTHVPKVGDSQEFNNVIGTASKLSIDNLVLNIKIHQKMHTESKLLVYYIRSDGEIVGMEKELVIEDCVNNKVEANWIPSQKQPGEAVSLKIQAATGSLCAVGVVDRRTEFLKTRLRPDFKELFKAVQKPTTMESSFESCDFFTEEEHLPDWNLPKKRSIYMPPTHYSTKVSFKDFGTIIMTDLTLVKPLCTPGAPEYLPRLSGEPMAVFYSAMTPDNYQTQPSNEGADVRSYFPETWLWELTRIGRTGEVSVKRNLPHSITQWTGEAICISASAGLGIANLEPLTSFQPFYVDLITPYSVKRNEVFHLKVLVFNYLNHSLPVRIAVKETPEIKLLESDEASLTVCINANDTVTNIFRIVATSLNKVNVTVTAEVDSAYPGNCGPEVLVDTRDTVTKSVKVDYEGFPTENIKSRYVCLGGAENSTDSKYIKWDIELPYDVIENSTRLKVLMDNDPLSLSIQNVGDLLNMPRGCGEQIMATLAPNLYILRYLNSTGGLTNEIYEKATKNIKIGYERVMQYSHRDGSFSAFGEERGEDGSLLLTAFVVRTLSLASRYVYIDKYVIERASNWLLDRQLENGCFSGGSHVFQSGLSHDDTENSGITAYVLISLLEPGVTINDKVSKNAKYCLRVGHTKGNKYTLAISTYALALLGEKDDEQLSHCLERLNQLATKKHNMLWWEDSDSASNSIEMTSYVILSLLTRGHVDDITMASAAARWLTTQRNSLGGFQSTQDTNVALDALTRYQMIVTAPPTNLSIIISTKNGRSARIYKIRDSDRLKTKQMSTNQIGDSIAFNITGEGCIILQGILKYNVPQIISGEAFTLAVMTSPVSTIDPCSVANISPCFSSSLPAAHSDMAILEVDLPSGYVADQTSLHNLHKNNNKVQRFEEADNKVIIYFTSLNEETICTTFSINEVSVVESRQPALVKLYDYYNPALAVYTSYNISKCNDTFEYQQDAGMNFDEANEIHNSGLNPDFVDRDIELDVPEGVEGPQPVYVKPPDYLRSNN